MKWVSLHRRLRLQRPSKLQQVDLPVKAGDKYDEASGQVYSEAIVSVPSTDELNWPDRIRVVKEPQEARTLGYQAPPPNARPSKGARSLQDMAIETVIRSLRILDLDYLDQLPSPLLDRVWFEVNKSGIVSFNIWRAFSKILLDRGDTTLRLLRYRETNELPTLPLQYYTTPLTSVSFEFITSLSLTTYYPLPDLVKLSGISNLGVLEIIKPSGSTQDVATVKSPVGNRLIRAWSLAAMEEGAFKVLRILRLWHHPDLTSKSLVYLNTFPALGVYDVRGCNFDSTPHMLCGQYGWQSSFDFNILGVLQAACITRAMKLQELQGLVPKPIRRSSAEQLWDGAKVWKLPREEVPSFLTRASTSRPGTPRPNVDSYNGLNTLVDKLQADNPALDINKYRWETLDRSMSHDSRTKQTWDFQTYTAFARLGELRSDRDLAKAGIEIGDQAMVEEELVNSVPMVSFRLGPSPPELRPDSRNNSSHKPLYNNVYNESTSSSTNPWEPFSPRNPNCLCFTRIKIPVHPPGPAVTNLEEDKENVAPESMSPAKRKKTTVTKSKKMKLGDVLGSFL